MIKDDGIGLPADLASSKGMGLRIMRYRATMIGGLLTIERDPGGGTSVTCSILNEPRLKTRRPPDHAKRTQETQVQGAHC
jgi:nitrate/nitrite-specific signal transduction histidine kinase